MREATQVLVIGSGAGGAVTALELARKGLDVTVLEEGVHHGVKPFGPGSPAAMRAMYRRCGMTPILGPSPIGYVEGACVGGSTEINSGFWHRTPPEVLLRYKAQFDLANATPEELEPHFAWAEALTGVGRWEAEWPMSTRVFARGIEAMGWAYHEVPRTAARDRRAEPTVTGHGMSRAAWPKATEAGAKLLSRCRVHQILFRGERASGVLAEVVREGGERELVRVDADHVFVCAGPTETPALLRRTGIKFRVGDTLRIHPMLKVVGRFPQTIDAADGVLPLLQVKEFWPDISLGGAFFTRGHLAMLLSDNWPTNAKEMASLRNMAAYYVAVKGSGRGWVRPSVLGSAVTMMGYDLSDTDVRNLSTGLARLASALLAAGAEKVFPTVHGLPCIASETDAARWLDETLPRRCLSLTTVHAFSSVPIGEREDRCAADSFGKVRGFSNLYVNDASMLPDSPGVNPQGTIMALARRNVLHFLDRSA